MITPKSHAKAKEIAELVWHHPEKHVESMGILATAYLDLLERCGELEKVLEFYGDTDNWVHQVMLSQDPEAPLVDYFVEEHGGKRAREALKTSKMGSEL